MTRLAVTTGTVGEAGVVKPNPRPTFSSVAVETVAGVVLRGSIVAIGAGSQPQVRNIARKPAGAGVAVDAGPRIVTRWQLRGMAGGAIIVTGVVKPDFPPSGSDVA